MTEPQTRAPAQPPSDRLSAAASRALEWFESDNFVPIGYSRCDANIGPVTQKVFDDIRSALAAQPPAAPVERPCGTADTCVCEIAGKMTCAPVSPSSAESSVLRIYARQ